jgi:multiple antibiotic resistance protein
MGRALVSGRRYAIAVDAAWRDGAGRPLRESYRHEFIAGPAIEHPIDFDWKISPPRAGTLDPVVVVFPDALESRPVAPRGRRQSERTETARGRRRNRPLRNRMAFYAVHGLERGPVRRCRTVDSGRRGRPTASAKPSKSIPRTPRRRAPNAMSTGFPSRFDESQRDHPVHDDAAGHRQPDWVGGALRGAGRTVFGNRSAPDGQPGALAVLIILLVCAWIGKWLLHLLGITLPMLQAAGGLILLTYGLRMVTVEETKLTAAEQSSVEEVPESHWKALAVVPLAIPGTVGAGSITTMIIQATTYDSWRDLAIISLVAVATALVMWITFRSAGPIARRLGPIGLNIVTRVMGIVVSATAFGLLGRGIGGLLPGLAR